MPRKIWKIWWSRPAGGRELLQLAVPLVVSTVSWTVMNFIDRMFLFWYSQSAIAAALAAGVTHFALLCFPLGIASYATTFVAQYHGADRSERIGAAVWQAVRFAGYTTPLLLLGIPLAPKLFALFGHDPEIQALEVLYFQVLTFGAGALVLGAALAAYFTGRGMTKVVMYVDCSAAVVNIVLDYLWIFGHAGFPKLGIEGAAWATVAALWMKVVVYLVVMLAPKSREAFGLVSGRRFDGLLMRRLLRFGAPSGLQLFVEVSAFTYFVLLVGMLGRDAMTATSLAFNVNSITFVPMFGLGMAVSTLVGQQLGRDAPNLAARAAWTGCQIGIVYSLLMGALYVSTPDLFLFGHAAGVATGEFQTLRATTALLLKFVAAYCLFDTVAVIFVSAIKGAGDTRFILGVTLLMSPVPIALAWAGINYFDAGLLWCWTVLTGWICTAAVIYLVRFLGGRWREMRVIEPDLDPQSLRVDLRAPLTGQIGPEIAAAAVEISP
ncbi:MAG: MATE family efflux transporter [Planctomycetales bacterium]|nr:MATE family efflux transporter [Planctomycetales bacterium]